MGPASTAPLDIIPLDEAGTLPGLFMKRLRRTPQAIAYCEHQENHWSEFSWSMMAHRIYRLRGALMRAELRPRDRVAVLLPNGTDWVTFDIAAMANGLIPVPLFAHDSAENIAYILANSDARLCLIDTEARWTELAPLLHAHRALEHVWVKQGLNVLPQPRSGPPRLRALADALKEAQSDTSPPRCRPQDIATIIYTSGTTGRPKGVMLTHTAIIWNAEAITKFIPPLPSDIFLSLLPLAHAFERTMGYYLPMMAGSRVAFARSIEVLREDLVTIRPTILLAVPRLYERIYEAIRRQAEGSPIRSWLIALAAGIGWQLHEFRRGRGPSPCLVGRWVLWPLLRWLVARRILAAFGGQVRVAVSGGAALSGKVARFLVGLGLPLVEGYGLTEAGPVVTATTLEDSLPGSVGRPLPGLDVRLTEKSELMVQSPAIMQGYWQDAEATACALSADGWLKTGDTAEICEGRLFITGRLKDILVLSTGENIAPSSIESAIQIDPLFEQVCVIGDRRPCVVAIAVLNQERWFQLARDLGIDRTEPNVKAAVDAALTRIAAVTRDLPSSWQVRAIYMAVDAWTIGDGSLTPTLKIKRRAIEQRFEEQIDALYSNIAERRDSDASTDRG